MNWRVHWISTNRTFQQLMDAGCRSNSVGAHRIDVTSASIARLCGRKLRVMMVGVDLILIHAVRGWHTLNAHQVHQLTKPNPLPSTTEGKNTKRETPTYENPKFHRINYLGIPPFFSIFFLQFPFFFSHFLEEEKKTERIGEERWGWTWIDKWMNRRVPIKPNSVLVKNRFFSSLSLSFSLFRGLDCVVLWRERNEKRTVNFRKIRLLMSRSNGN